MKLNTLKTPEINQNGYHKNSLTKERIGTLFIYPIDFTPDDCLSCEGYSLSIEDYKDLYKVIGTKFNKNDDSVGTFRIPDYNVTGRFLQPGAKVGNLINAGLPNIVGTMGCPAVKTAERNNAARWTGAFYRKDGAGASTTDASVNVGTGFDASRSSSIYGNSSTVQPNSQIVHICIKYK